MDCRLLPSAKEVALYDDPNGFKVIAAVTCGETVFLEEPPDVAIEKSRVSIKRNVVPFFGYIDVRWIFPNRPAKADSAKPTIATQAPDLRQKIKVKCGREWPDDFRMQAYCVERQTEALLNLPFEAPAGITKSDHDKALSRCLTDWPDDYVMLKYCVEQQHEAIRKLR